MAVSKSEKEIKFLIIIILNLKKLTNLQSISSFSHLLSDLYSYCIIFYLINYTLTIKIY
jgi:hypothetical protein